MCFHQFVAKRVGMDMEIRCTKCGREAHRKKRYVLICCLVFHRMGSRYIAKKMRYGFLAENDCRHGGVSGRIFRRGGDFLSVFDNGEIRGRG